MLSDEAAFMLLFCRLSPLFDLQAVVIGVKFALGFRFRSRGFFQNLKNSSGIFQISYDGLRFLRI